MKSLRTYLRTLKYEQRLGYAESCGTSLAYVYKVARSGGRHKFGASLARLLDENSGGAVKRAELRPDVWPELLEKHD